MGTPWEGTRDWTCDGTWDWTWDGTWDGTGDGKAHETIEHHCLAGQDNGHSGRDRSGGGDRHDGRQHYRPRAGALRAFLPGSVNHVIDLVTEIIMTLVLVLIARQLYYGMIDKLSYSETTFILQFPLWWPYAACLVAAVIAVIVSIYMVFVRYREFRAGTPTPGLGQGSVH